MSKAYKISRRRLIASGLDTAILAAWPSRSLAAAKMQKIQGDENDSVDAVPFIRWPLP